MTQISLLGYYYGVFFACLFSLQKRVPDSFHSCGQRVVSVCSLLSGLLMRFCINLGEREGGEVTLLPGLTCSSKTFLEELGYNIPDQIA